MIKKLALVVTAVVAIVIIKKALKNKKDDKELEARTGLQNPPKPPKGSGPR